MVLMVLMGNTIVYRTIVVDGNEISAEVLTGSRARFVLSRSTHFTKVYDVEGSYYLVRWTHGNGLIKKTTYKSLCIHK